ncbi:NAD-dependent epimerase/dehydratase family protein [Rhodothermus marinus]|uniref:NAD-dependent epimerase/dehydratase family protein n=1 Tax=Rhodothermus marinus TaxID=29549 RepID=UPI0012BA4CDA|nr:NAD-dependent epimerase/dehydratase family protein [Rhodothermus marinus]BBM70892.1 NAD-dependent epimerase [Rhodothermus marinus]BBM73871.1 NAD-dependent epimerase [Rhodothermus marinus]
MNRGVAFVTGGTGFIGSHLVEELLRRGYREVRCLVRKELRWLEGLDIVPVRGDFSRIEVLWEAVRDADVVFHVAGVTRARDWATFEQGNITATLNLLGTILEANPNVRKVLITSSLAAVGYCPGGVATEESPLRPISAYGRSKALMEQALRAPRADGPPFAERLPIVIVRPPAVYGPREADIYTFFRTVSRGLCPIVGSGRRPELSLVHVRDLVRGMVDAAESDVTTGQTYFIGSEQFYSWREIRDATLKALGRRALTVHIPPFLVEPIGALVELAGRLTGTYPPLNREKAREIRHACKMCAVDKARRDFDYRQQIGLEEGIQETIAWYRQQGWL